MTAPGLHVRNSTYLFTRRCSERRYFLRPSLHTNQTYLYCLGRAAALGDISVHTATAMSNHHHQTLTQRREGGMSDYAEWMHGQMGRALNASIGHWEGFWTSTRSYSAQLLGIAGELDPLEYAEDILLRSVYVITNPVRGELVKSYRDWPGVCSLNWRIGEPITIARPRGFFLPDGPTPPEVTVTFEKPPGFENYTDREFDQLLRHEVAEEEKSLNRERKRKGRRVLGRAHVLKQNPLASPKTPAPRRQLNPLVASRCPKRRSYLLNRIFDFRSEYRGSLERLWQGDRNVVFPYGTLQRRRYGGVRCRGPVETWVQVDSRAPP